MVEEFYTILILETLYAPIFFFPETFTIYLSSVLKFCKDVTCYWSFHIYRAGYLMYPLNSEMYIFPFWEMQLNYFINSFLFSVVSLLSGTPFIQIFGLLEHSNFLCFHSLLSTCCELYLPTCLLNVLCSHIDNFFNFSFFFFNSLLFLFHGFW